MNWGQIIGWGGALWSGFVMAGRRRLPTTYEEIAGITMDAFSKALPLEIKRSQRMMYFFTGNFPHTQHLPKQWGAPECGT